MYVFVSAVDLSSAITMHIQHGDVDVHVHCDTADEAAQAFARYNVTREWDVGCSSTIFENVCAHATLEKAMLLHAQNVLDA